MPMEQVTFSVPQAMISYVKAESPRDELLRNAMMLYPYIQRQMISHGKAAEMLGIYKIDLIELYGQMGIPYLDETAEELENELNAIKIFREKKCSKKQQGLTWANPKRLLCLAKPTRIFF